VTLAGAGFTGATAVTFNGAPATFTVASDTTITTTVPAGASTGPVAVTTPGGTATSSTPFTFVPAPVVSGFLPTSGGTGTPVTLTGVNFTGATAVAFAGTAAAFSVASATSITTAVPAGAATGTISVTTPGGTGASASSFTFVPAPTVSGFLPASGKIGDSVTLTGTNLTGATAVALNGTAAAFSVASATTLTATVPAGATTGVFSVTTPGGTGASAAAFTVIPAPVISGFNPASGGPGVQVVLAGTHFTGATAVTFANGAATVPASSFTVASDTSITATVPASATAGGITVTTPGGTAVSDRFVAGFLALYAGVDSGIGNADAASGAAARFYGPYGVAVDAAGNVYVADRSNQVIRRITPAGVVSTLAGTADVAGHGDTSGGAVLFDNPASVAVGPVTGNLYVADRANSDIRMVTPAGVVTTFAGTGTSGDTDGSSTALPAPSFFNPTGVAVDAAENVYVADSGNNSIRKIVPASPGTLPVTVSTLTPPSSLSNPASVAVAGAVVFVADNGTGAIRTVPTTGGAVTLLASGFSNPLGIAADGSVPANVYVADAGTSLISVVNGSTGAVSLFAGWGDHSGSIEGYGATPASDTMIGTAPEFDFPTGIALGTPGNPTSGLAFVADSSNNTIRKVPITPGTPPTSTVTTSTYAGQPGAPGLADGTLVGSALFNGPAGVAVDAAGHIWVADTNNNAVRELYPAPSGTGATTPALAGPAFSAPTGVAVDTFTGSGNIYVADSGHNAIQVISGSTVTTLSAGTTFNSPFGVAVDGAGNLYVADTFNNLVKKVTIAAPATYPVTGTTTDLPGSCNHPFGVAVNPATGAVYVADT
jgi:DNA-binding beta-propeller fold protein YncE